MYEAALVLFIFQPKNCYFQQKARATLGIEYRMEVSSLPSTDPRYFVVHLYKIIIHSISKKIHRFGTLSLAELQTLGVWCKANVGE